MTVAPLPDRARQPALRAGVAGWLRCSLLVTIRGVAEFICHEIIDRPAIAFPFELATARFSGFIMRSRSLRG
jgi:hypothetical protein